MKLINEICYVQNQYSVNLKRQIEKAVLMIPGAGCEYWKKTGGCTVCGFNNLVKKYSLGRRYPFIMLWALWRMAYKMICRADSLSVFIGGSFLNDKEMRLHFQQYLCKAVSKTEKLKELLIETRCEYINEKNIREFVDLLNGKKLRVAIGLESKNNYIRNDVIKKGLSIKLFERKVKILRDNGAEAFVYAFLKPMNVSEADAYIDVIETIKYCLSIGVSEINISCGFVQEGTVLYDEYTKGAYTPPSLWSILELIKEIQENNWPVSIGNFTDKPTPIAIPGSCDECSAINYLKIDEYRRNGYINQFPSCGRCGNNVERPFRLSMKMLAK